MDTPNDRSSVSKGWWIAFLSCLTLGVAATLPPFVSESAREIIMGGFSAVCHQLPSRSHHIDGISLAVCHRCAGIYYATVFGAIVLLVMRRRQDILSEKAGLIIVASLAPLGIDWLVDVLGWWKNTPTSRFATGALFGVAAGIYFTKAVVELFEKRRDEKTRSSVEVATADINVDVL